MALLQEIQVPLLAVNDSILTVAELSFATGDRVKKGDIVMVLETSKTTYDVVAEAEGFINYSCQAGNDYEVNTVIARIFSEVGEAGTVVLGPAGFSGAVAGVASVPGVAPAGVAAVSAVALATAAAVTAERYWEGETFFSNEALRMMEAAGIGRDVFVGRDLITGADVKKLLSPASEGVTRSAAAAVGRSAASAAPAAAQRALQVDPVKAIVEKLSGAKKREIEYLSDVQAAGLTSTVNIYVNTEGIFTFMNRGLRYLKDSLLPVVIYETGRLLADYPQLNGYFAGDAVALYKDINPGFAIDIEKGLKVLKIPAADQKSIAEIESAILELSGKYLDDTLQVEELTEITFTITDLSSEGVAFFRPLINKMNSAILGVSAIDDKLQRCTLSLTFDHRVTEGKLAARFLRELKDRLESYRPKELPGKKDIACFKCYKTLQEDLSGAGFARCVTPEGTDGYICQSCLNGF